MTKKRLVWWWHREELWWHCIPANSWHARVWHIGYKRGQKAMSMATWQVSGPGFQSQGTARSEDAAKAAARRAVEAAYGV